MSRPVRGQEVLDDALIAIAAAKTIEQLRQAQAVALPLQYGMNLKTAVQATEITEDTERGRVSHAFNVYPMGERVINDNPLFFSVNSVFSVANCFF